MLYKTFRLAMIGMGLLGLGGIASCGDGGKPFSGDVRGKVQKGPFILGAEISVSELDENMGQTGRTFGSTISDDTGSFRVAGVQLANSVARVRATGYYYDETARGISDGPLSLVTYVDFEDRVSANLNVFGHLQSSRIEYLVQEEGMSFGQARAQAHGEVLAVFGFEAASESSADELDITQAGDDNAMLLAASIILQSTRSVGQLSELLSAIQTDLRTDGRLDSTASRSALMNGAWAANSARIREGLVARFDALGVTATVPEFEPYLQDFMDEMPYPHTGAIKYPADAELPNILELDRTEYVFDSRNYRPEGNAQFLAEIPVNTELRIRMTWRGQGPLNYSIWAFYPNEAFDHRIELDDQVVPNQFVQSWTAKTTGRVAMSFIFSCYGQCIEGGALVEYFEYGRSEPTRVKTIRWWDSSLGAQQSACYNNPCNRPPALACNSARNGLLVPSRAEGICSDDGGTATCDYDIREVACATGEVCDTCPIEPGRMLEACCYTPGAEGEPCHMIPPLPDGGAPADTCGAGLYCWDGGVRIHEVGSCVPAGGDSQPCYLDSTCNDGFVCSGYCPQWGQCCLPLGKDGDACDPGAGYRCEGRLVCGAWSDCPSAGQCCRAAGGLGERCQISGECDAGLTCGPCGGADDPFCCVSGAGE